MIAELSSTTLRWDALPPLWLVVLVIVPLVALAVRFVYRREPVLARALKQPESAVVGLGSVKAEPVAPAIPVPALIH